MTTLKNILSSNLLDNFNLQEMKLMKLMKKLMKLAVVVPCRVNAYSAHWFVFFLCARFRPVFIGFYGILYMWLSKD